MYHLGVWVLNCAHHFVIAGRHLHFLKLLCNSGVLPNEPWKHTLGAFCRKYLGLFMKISHDDFPQNSLKRNSTWLQMMPHFG